jgi:hypothetical protein
MHICLWLYSPFLGLGRFFSFLIFTVNRTPWTGDEPVARPLPIHRAAQTQNKRTQTSMPQLWSEPTIPAFDRAKTVHALDRAATMIGKTCPYSAQYGAPACRALNCSSRFVQQMSVTETIQNSYSIERLRNKNWKRQVCWRKRPWSNLRHSPSGTEEKHEKPLLK